MVPAVLWVLCLTGCGAPAAPQPPTLNLPQPVRDLTAARIGNITSLTFAVPDKTTDKLPVRGDMTAQVCRGIEAGPCQPVTTLALSAQKTASFDDDLPADLTQGPPRLLTYRISIQNRAGKSAGNSTAAFAVAGAAPAPLADFRTTPRRDGILLTWQEFSVPENATNWIRFDRTRTAGPTAPAQPAPGGQMSPEEPTEQSLRVRETASEHRPMALDATVRAGRSYRYAAQRVVQAQLGGHTLQMASAPTAPVEVAYRDVFPPSVPTGLVTAADTPGNAIDLSWTPDIDPGLAGYVVYRRPAADPSATPQRISPLGKPTPSPAWRDATVLPGRRYAYSVSAVDASGNESQRCAEVEEGLGAGTPHP